VRPRGACVAIVLFGALLAWKAWVPQVGQPAPEFELNTLDGGQASLSALRGRRVYDIRRFVDEFRLPFPVALDERGKVRRRYGLIGVPSTVFVDSSGVVRAVHSGPMTHESLDQDLTTILPRP